MACQKCAELSNTVEELWTHIQTKRSQVIRDVVNLAAEPNIAIQDVLDILLRYVALETNEKYPDLACPERGCPYAANTYQLLQRHYLRHVSYGLDCPFCSKPLQRVSQAEGHLSRCNARNGRPMPENIVKRKLDAYKKLQQAHNDKKRQASELMISDFPTALEPSTRAVCHSEKQLRGSQTPGQADLSQQTTNLPSQVGENLFHGTAAVSFIDQQLIHFAGASQQVLAPGLVDNFVDGGASFSPMLLSGAPQLALAPGLVDNFVDGGVSFSPMPLSGAPQLALAPGLVDNFVDGGVSFSPMPLSGAPQLALAPGLVDNLAEGGVSFSPMQLANASQQTQALGLDSFPSTGHWRKQPPVTPPSHLHGGMHAY